MIQHKPLQAGNLILEQQLKASLHSVDNSVHGGVISKSLMCCMLVDLYRLCWCTLNIVLLETALC